MKPVPETQSNSITLPNYLSANLKVLRKVKGWSQAELAERAAMNRGNVASYESGGAEPSICKTLRFCNLFEIGPRDLIRRDLSDPQELTLAQIARNQDQDDHRAKINLLKEQASQLEELVRSSRNLFDYKRENLSSTCAEADQYAAHYEQLHQITQQLIANHRQLLTEAGCHCD